MQLFASLQNCMYIVLNAWHLYCLLIHKLKSRLHPCCIHFQLQCSTQFKKVLFLDFANAKSLITSSKSTERSMSASMQSRDRESNLSWPIVVPHRFLILSGYSVHALMVSVALYCLLRIVLQHSNIIFLFFWGRPFVKRFALYYRTVVCLSVCPVLSVTLVYCGQKPNVSVSSRSRKLRSRLHPWH